MNTQARYFIYDELLRLKNEYASLDAETRAAIKAHVALNCPDPQAAVLFADIANDDWAHIYPVQERPQPLSTSKAIDTFLETYGHSTPEEDALLERLIFNPTPDYSTILEVESKNSEVDAPDDLTTERIDSFMASHPEGVFASQRKTEEVVAPSEAAKIVAENDGEPVASVPCLHKPKEMSQTSAPSSLSESLAKIYIKQGKYERAYEIISDLNLKNPKKSVYFADQLRFLRKLMLICQQVDCVVDRKASPEIDA